MNKLCMSESESQEYVKQIERRDFLKGITLLGGLALLSPIVSSCIRGVESMRSNVPTNVTAESGLPNEDAFPSTSISLVRTRDRIEGVRRAISLLKYNPVAGKAVVLKPNFNTADPTPGSTHIDTLRSLILTLQDMGATSITLAERSGPGDSTRVVMEKKGIFDLAAEHGFEIVNLQEADSNEWVHLHPRDSHWEDGFHFPRVYLEAESIVQTCCLKTHAYGGHFTLSLKNSVGMVPRDNYPYMRELHTSPYQRQMIAEINLAYSPDIVVLDGVDAFVDGGPATGKKIEAGVILAGNDRVAIDAVGVAILRSLGTTTDVGRGPIFQQEQIARAVELGLGIKSPAQIKLITDDSESEAFAQNISDVLFQG